MKEPLHILYSYVNNYGYLYSCVNICRRLYSCSPTHTHTENM